nr:MAG TPA: hypothetical protein [Caudoviricetes sp.]
MSKPQGKRLIYSLVLQLTTSCSTTRLSHHFTFFSNSAKQ